MIVVERILEQLGTLCGFDVDGRNVSEDIKPGLDLRSSRIYERLCMILDALLFYIPVFTSPVTRSSISLSVRPLLKTFHINTDIDHTNKRLLLFLSIFYYVRFKISNESSTSIELSFAPLWGRTISSEHLGFRTHCLANQDRGMGVVFLHRRISTSNERSAT